MSSFFGGNWLRSPQPQQSRKDSEKENETSGSSSSPLSKSAPTSSPRTAGSPRSNLELLRDDNMKRNDQFINNLFKLNSTGGSGTNDMTAATSGTASRGDDETASNVGDGEAHDELLYHGRNVYDMTVVELKAALGQLGYNELKKNAKKAELLKILVGVLTSNFAGNTISSLTDDSQSNDHKSPVQREMHRISIHNHAEPSEYLREGLRSMDRHLRSSRTTPDYKPGLGPHAKHEKGKHVIC
jgi:hypothetical protein